MPQIEAFRKSLTQDVFTSIEISNFFRKSPDQRYSLIKRALAEQKIIHLRKGVYCFAPDYQKNNLNLYSMSQYIYGPSYISFESALSFHGWIPEAVYTVNSACLKRSQSFQNQLATFNYKKTSSFPFYAAVERHQEAQNVFFIATPLKAIADYIYVFQKNWTSIKPLIESLRIEEDALAEIKREHVEEIEAAFTNKRVRIFLKKTKKDLNL